MGKRSSDSWGNLQGAAFDRMMGAIMPESIVDGIAAELADASKQILVGHADPSGVINIDGRYAFARITGVSAGRTGEVIHAVAQMHPSVEV